MKYLTTAYINVYNYIFLTLKKKLSKYCNKIGNKLENAYCMNGLFNIPIFNFHAKNQFSKNLIQQFFTFSKTSEKIKKTKKPYHRLRLNMMPICSKRFSVIQFFREVMQLSSFFTIPNTIKTLSKLTFDEIRLNKKQVGHSDVCLFDKIQ